MSLVQFLASQKALGNLILAQGTGSGGVVVSYTPPKGKKFTLVRACYGGSGPLTCTLRNNGTVIDNGIGE